MSQRGFMLFETAIGPCGIAWTPRGVAALRFPEPTRAATLARLRRVCPGASEAAPPADIAAALEAIVSLLAGDAVDLSGIALDEDSTLPFDRSVYAIARTIPVGATLTYGEVAARLGDRGLARSVGQALGRNPAPIIVPCHRVVAAGGRAGGFSAPGGLSTKRRLLAIESRHGSAGMPLFAPTADAVPWA